MTLEKLNAIKARLAKPTPEPFKTMLEELVEAVEAKNTITGDGSGRKLPKFSNTVKQATAIDTPENTDA